LTPSGPTGATGQPAQPEAYVYNGDGTLVAQTAGTGSGAATTRYTQDLAIQPSAPGANGGPSTGLYAPTGHTPPPSQVLQARVTQSSGSDLVTDYAYGVDTGGNPARFASNPLGGGAHTWSVTDPQGSPRYTQDDTGQPTGTGTPAGMLNYDPQPVRYDPYGAINLGADGTGQVPQTFGYRGELQDANTGLVNLRARTYNPATGQFLTRDPLEQQTGQAYAYANSDPVNQSDPSGLASTRSTAVSLPSCSADPLRSDVESQFVQDTVVNGSFLDFTQQRDGNCEVPVPGFPPPYHNVVSSADVGHIWVIEPLENLLPTGYQAAEQKAQAYAAALRAHDAGPRGGCSSGVGLRLLSTDDGSTYTLKTELRPAIQPGLPAFNRYPFAYSANGGPPLNFLEETHTGLVTVGQLVVPAQGGGGRIVPGVLYYQRGDSTQHPPLDSCAGFDFHSLLHCAYQFVIGDDIAALKSGNLLAQAVGVVDVASNVVVLVPIAGAALKGGEKAVAKAALRGILGHEVEDTALHTVDEVGLRVSSQDVTQLSDGALQGFGTVTKVTSLSILAAAAHLVAPQPGSGGPLTPTGLPERDRKGRPIFREYESLLPNIALVDYGAIVNSRRRRVLHKMDDENATRRNRRASGCADRNGASPYKNNPDKSGPPYSGEPLTSCEEYPFATTYEGGRRAVIGPSVKRENSAQGAYITNFLNKFDLQDSGRHGKRGEFIVQVILKDGRESSIDLPDSGS